MNLLFIEDQPESVEPAIRRLRRSRKHSYTSRVVGFQETEQSIDEFAPDIVILDLLEVMDAGDRQPVGLAQYDIVWDRLFCPLVVYSAQPEIATDRHEPHPFVKAVQKGRDSITQLMETIRDLRPHVEALREAKLHIRHQFARALRDVAPYAFKSFKTRAEVSEAIIRSGRRRLAASMDTQPDETLAPWEHYLYPPLSNNIQLGDLLMMAGVPDDDPASFRVVLTPSCDLETSGGRTPKVSSALVARCCSIKKGLALTSLGIMNPNKLKSRLPSTVLTHGYFETILPLPGLSGRIPCMAANLRDIELIPLDHIGNDGVEFKRVASMDSPFRELVAWSYMQVAGRPGLPDRDFDKWTEEILAACRQEEEKESAHLKAFDFFCGAGGLTRGLLDAGIKVVAGIDSDEQCRRTYESNNEGAQFVKKDIREVTLTELKRLAGVESFGEVLFAGCAPCSPFSQKRKAPEPSNDLTLLMEFGHLVARGKPGFVLIENVPGLASVPGYSTFRRFVRLLENNGYRNRIVREVLDAKRFGVPQTRRRLVLIATRRGTPSLPKPRYGSKGRPFKTVRQTIARFPILRAGYEHTKIKNHVASAVEPINLERLIATPEDGGDRRDWPRRLRLACHPRGYDGHTDAYGRMWWDAPAPTLTGRCHSISNGRYAHPAQRRGISLREAAALQTFRDSYEFFGPHNHIARQIGNAVPVRLGKELGEHILRLKKQTDQLRRARRNGSKGNG